jgi:hypothetical protein
MGSDMRGAKHDDPDFVAESWSHVQALIIGSLRASNASNGCAETMLADLQAGRAVLWIVPVKLAEEDPCPAIFELRWRNKPPPLYAELDACTSGDVPRVPHTKPR